MRCFVAVKVSGPVRAALGPVLDDLRRAEADVRWEPEENLHVTVKFLGEIGEEAALRLKELLAAEASCRPAFPLEFAGLGTFPERGEPRVIWIGCRGDGGNLAGLAAALEQAAEQVGVPRETRPFSPHLTLGRVKSSRNVGRLRTAIAGGREVVASRQEVGALELMESTQTPRGAVYRGVASFRLAPARG